jgi:hypothetical protein
MQDADALEGRVDAALGRRLARRGEDLQVLATGQVAVEARFVHDRPDPGQRDVTVPRDGVAEEEHRAGVGVGQAQQHRINVVLPAPFGPRYPKAQPRGTRSSTSLTAMFSPNRLVSPWVSTPTGCLPLVGPRRPIVLYSHDNGNDGRPP